MAQIHSIVTVAGRNKEAAKKAANQKIVFKEIALGDGDRFPSGGETALQNEVHRGLITGSGVEAGTPNAHWFDLYVGADVDTFLAREIAVFDEDGVMYAVSRYDHPTPKFGPDSSNTSDNTFRIIVVLADTENVVVQVSPVAGITADTLSQHLPFATEVEFSNPNTKSRIAEVKQIHSLFVLKNGLIETPIFPEILNNDAKAALSTPVANKIRFDAFDIRWRGYEIIKFGELFTEAQRTFDTVANKTYHLKITRQNDGSWQVNLHDLADAAYNPSAKAENHVNFDSFYDEVFVGRIVTDAAGVPTFTALTHKAKLENIFQKLTTSYTTDTSAWYHNATAVLNWPRTANYTWLNESLDVTTDLDAKVSNVCTIDRYGLSAISRGYTWAVGSSWNAYASGTFTLRIHSS